MEAARMQKITPHLWFDTQAKEAAAFYTSVFDDSRVKSSNTLHNTPSGSVDFLTIELCGQEFALISAGPLFTFNPSISFIVACTTSEEVDSLWAKLSEGGSALMELGEYPFSKRYGWLQDRYGLSWQLLFAGDEEVTQKITPSLMFVGAQSGKAEEAIRFYVSLFPDSRVGELARYGKGMEPDAEEAVKYGRFTLAGQQFAAMDSAHAHKFAFNEAISLIVHCDSQEEIDHYWERLSADPKAEQCGWLKDRFGVSWQITPAVMDEMLASHDREKIDRVTKAFLRMKKFDIATLKAAFEGADCA
jgi:predicted 3-demethylubiquinone-9 3-methyltransferase (glyoxalase superfamily)